MPNCARCGHAIHHHGRGRGKCWAPNVRCSCGAYVAPTKPAVVETGSDVHVLPQEEIRQAIRVGLLVPTGEFVA